ncbi:MAG: tetratricopeptide repeat protein, partial [Bacteroidota bacterium]
MRHLLSLFTILISNCLLLNAQSDSLEIETFFQKGLELEKHRDFEGARVIYLNIVEQAKEKKLHESYAKILNQLGLNYTASRQLDSAIIWYELLHEEDKLLHFTNYRLIYSSFRYLGANYSRMKKLLQSLQVFKNCVNYVKQNISHLNGDVELARAYNNVAVSYEVLGDTKTTLTYLDSALKDLKENLDKPNELEAHIYGNKGNAYKKLGFFDEAADYMLMQEDVYKKLPEAVVSYNDWGWVY